LLYLYITGNPLDALCPWLNWGCRFLRVDHRTLVDKVRDEKALAVLRMGVSKLTDVLAARRPYWGTTRTRRR
jgi:hypothetical protein